MNLNKPSNLNSEKPKSLYRQLTFALIAVISAASISASFLFYFYSVNETNKLIANSFKSYSTDLREALEWPLWNIDNEMIEKVGKAYIANDDFVSLTIRDDHEGVLFHKERNATNSLKKEYLVEHKNTKIGSFEIGLSLDFHHKTNRILLLSNLSISLIIIVIIYFIFGWVLTINLKKPMEALVELTDKIVEGFYPEIDYSKTYAEFVPIISGFKTMYEAIANREDSLRKSEQKFLSILENVDAYIYLKDTQGRYIFANKPVRQLWQVEMKDLVGFGDEKFFDAQTALNISKNDSRVLIDGETLRTEETNTVPVTGETATYQSTKLPLKDENGNIYALCGISVDITERIKTQERLTQAIASAEAANKAKSVFLASMSHEIRTPLNSVVGLTEVLLDSKLTSEQRRLMIVAHAAGENLLYLINDILDLSRVESGNITLEQIPFFLTEQIENSISIVQVRVREKNLHLTWKIDPDVPNCVIGDPTKVRQIIINLLSNAVKFSDNGEVKISVSKTSYTDDVSKLVFAISDQGIGIDPVKLKILFEPFKQVDSSITRRFGGSGLGLAISKKLVNLMRGEIWAKSELGKGSTFFFTAHLPAAPSLGTTGRLANTKVLIFSSNPLFLSEAEALLLAEQAVIITARSEDEALEVLTLKSDFPIKFVLTECGGVKTNACDFVKKLRAIPNISQPIKILSIGEGHCKIKNVGLELGIYCDLSSPLTKENLIRRMEGYSEEQKSFDLPKNNKVRPLKVLLVEDSQDNKILIEVFLKGQPHQLIYAENGLEAVKFFKEQPFDIILMDVQMPVMDGYTATREIRKWEAENNKSAIPILALTAHAFEEDVQASKNAGCTEHVTKPLKKQRLLDLLAKYS